MAKKILLADDSITIQKVIELTFSDEDFDVITVGNGRLALERLPEVRPDIVLCDIIMPEKDGYEVCEQVKSNPSWSHLPVLLLTGAFEPFDQERAARAGYDGSLAKPFEPETLIAKVKDLLARAPSRAAAAPPVAPPVPTVVPFARPAAVAPPPVAAAPVLSAPIGSGFISDEPFPEVDEAPPGHVAAPPAPPAAAAPPLAELSEEESAMLSTPPSSGGVEDAASTVMFRPVELPWTPPAPTVAPAPPLAVPEPPPAPSVVARVVLPEPKGEPEPVLVPETRAPLPAADEAPVFEAVLDEDLDFGPAGFEPEPAPEQAGGETLFAPEPPAEPVPPPEPVPEPPPAPEPSRPVIEAAASTPEPVSSLDDLVSAAPAAQAPEPAFVEESLLQSEPEPVAERLAEPAPYAAFDPPYPGVPEPTPLPAPQPEPRPSPWPLPVPQPAPLPEPAAPPPQPAPGPAPAPVPVPEPEPAPAPTPTPVPAVAPPSVPVAGQPERADLDAGTAATAAGPLADLALPAEEPPITPVSQAAAFSVPVDMVEKIAQRVVAQVSEKVVREIAWEVIPDLAEALIKQEIERLKAELQKT